MCCESLRPGPAPGKPSVSLFESYCRLQGVDPAAQRAANAAADRHYRRLARGVVSGGQTARPSPETDAIAVLHRLVLAQERELREVRGTLEVTRADLEALRRELSLLGQRLRHLEEDLPEGIRVVVDQALEDRDAERGRP
jgi:hypothetical protein